MKIREEGTLLTLPTLPSPCSTGAEVIKSDASVRMLVMRAPSIPAAQYTRTYSVHEQSIQSAPTNFDCDCTRKIVVR